jgi:hypothetical protein
MLRASGVGGRGPLKLVRRRRKQDKEGNLKLKEGPSASARLRLKGKIGLLAFSPRASGCWLLGVCEAVCSARCVLHKLGRALSKRVSLRRLVPVVRGHPCVTHARALLLQGKSTPQSLLLQLDVHQPNRKPKNRSNSTTMPGTHTQISLAVRWLLFEFWDLSPAHLVTFQRAFTLSLSSLQVFRPLVLCSGATLAGSSFSACIATTWYHLSACSRLASGLVTFSTASESQSL